MTLTHLVNEMRTLNAHKQKCLDEQDTLNKCILCKYYLSSNKWSLLLENHIKQIFNLKSKLDNNSGDAVSPGGKRIEIKVSLGDSSGKFNFVQLRPHHHIDYYIFLVYNMYDGDIGSIYWFLCEADELYRLIPEYGGYSHGTVDTLGAISIASLYNGNDKKEYSLRPSPVMNACSKPRKLWDEMVSNFQVSKDTIIEKLC